MNKLKELQEKLGAARKKLNQFTNDRAEKLTKLSALGEKNELTEDEQNEFNASRNDIDAIDAKMDNQQTVVDNLEGQVNYERLHGDQVEPGPHNVHPGGNEPKGPENEISDFSYVKMFREALDGGPQNITGLEAEMHQEAIRDAKNKGIKLNGNVHVPTVVMEASRKIANDVTVTGGSGGDQGGLTVQKNVMSLIDILRARLPFVDSSANNQDGLGATFFTDVSGNMSFPRAVEGTDAATKSETATADEISPTFEELELTPTRLPAFVEVSRQTLLQSSVDVEAWLRNHLAYKIGKPMHTNIIQAILDASGTNAQSHGTDGGAETWESIVKYETDVLNSDAAMEDDPRLGWLTNSKVRGKLKTTEIASNTAQFIYDRNDKTVNEYNMFVSSLVPSNLNKGSTTDDSLSASIFANWASLYIAMWGGMSFLVNPYSKDTEGLIRINAWTFYDSGLRHASAFSVGKDIVTS